MTDLEPLSGELVASTLAEGRSLLARLTSTHATVFDGAPGVRELYVDVFRELVGEAEQLPGYSTAMLLVIERYAFVWATQKAADSLETPLSARDYEGLLLRFRQLWDGLLKARDDRQADEQFKALFITEFMRAFAATCEELLDPEVSRQVQRAVVERMRATNVGATERRR